MSASKKHSKQSSGAQKMTSSPSEIYLDLIVGIHPAVPSWLILDRIFGTNDLGYVTNSAIELFLRNHPIGLTPKNENGQHFVITGLRSWQILKVAELRQLIGIRRVMAIIHPEATDDRIEKIAISSTLLDLDLFSIDALNAQAQIAEILVHVNDETWGELFGKRARPTLTKMRAQRGAAEVSPPLRGRGRPRTRPQIDPSTPQRPVGRPKKVAPPEKNEVDLTASIAVVDSDNAEQ